MSLRNKFFLTLSLLTAVPLLVLLFGVVDHLENQVRNRTEAELHVTLDKMADELSLILDNQKSIARGLAHVPAVRQFSALVNDKVGKGVSAEEYRRRADELEQFFLNYQAVVPSIQALRFIDNDGKTLVKVKEGKPVEPKLLDEKYKRHYVADQSYKTFYKYTLTAKQDVVMSDFELGQVTFDADFCPAMVRYSTPIRDELDRDEGMLVVNMWGVRLDSTVEASLGGYPGKAFLIEINNTDPSRDGIYLYHEDINKRFANQLKSEFRFSNEITKDEWQKIRTSERGSLFKGDRMLFYRVMTPFEDRKSTRWLLLIDADSTTVLAPIQDIRRSIWLLLALLLLASLMISVWAAYRLAKPVHELAGVITEYANGVESARYHDDRKDEIGLAGKAFNYLTESLKKARSERDKAERLARQSERLASVGQLAAGIGHEINNPLMNIMSLAALIEDELKNKDEQCISDIQLLQKEGKRCARIVQGILSFARENRPEYREFDMSELIEETLNLLQHRIESAEITVVTDLNRNLYMTGDDRQLQQVLVNVILNAVQASPGGGTIHITAKKDIDYVSVEIIDTGTGISSDDLTRVFDPFFTTKSEGEGTGLGLSVSYGIVKHHGGTIHLENTEDSGLRVIILLPFRAQIDEE